jgi:hypothetical protein
MSENAATESRNKKTKKEWVVEWDKEYDHF